MKQVERGAFPLPQNWGEDVAASLVTYLSVLIDNHRKISTLGRSRKRRQLANPEVVRSESFLMTVDGFPPWNDLKSWVPRGACGFDSRPRHQFPDRRASSLGRSQPRRSP